MSSDLTLLGEIILKKPATLLALLVPALASGILVFLRHLNNGSFVQDDFIFLRLLQESESPIGLVITPLFGHFSPMAWMLHLIVHINGTTWIAALIVSSLFVFASAMMLALVARRLGAPLLLSSAIAFVWPLSLANERLMSWWSAFANDSPQTLFLLISVFGFIGVLQNKNVALNVSISIAGTLLSFASYELAMLTPIFLVAVIPLVDVSERNKQRRAYISIIIGNFAFAFLFFLWSRMVLPQTSSTGDISSAGKSVFAFISTDIAAISGLAPPSNWRDSVIVVLLVATAVLCASILGKIVGKFLFGLVPVLGVAAALAYARSGYDVDLDFPHYPMDLQYHSLSTAWFYLLATLAVGEFLKVYSRANKSRYLAPSLLIAPTLLGFLMADFTPYDISDNKNMRELARSYESELSMITPDQFVANENTPFVLPIFGYYSTLSSTVHVTNYPQSAQILGGNEPLVFDEHGKLKPFLYTVGTGCFKPQSIEGGFRVEIVPSSAGSTVGLKIPEAVAGNRTINGVFIDSDGGYKTMALGEIQSTDELMLTKVPLVPNEERGAQDLALKYLDFSGALTDGDSCLRAITKK